MESKHEKFQVQESLKEAKLSVFWDMKGPITIDFLVKRATVNRASCSRKNFVFLFGV